MGELLIQIKLADSSKAQMAALINPQMWAAYRGSALEEVATGVKSIIQMEAAKVWGERAGSWWVSHNTSEASATVKNSEHSHWNRRSKPRQAPPAAEVAWDKYPYQVGAPAEQTAAELQPGKWLQFLTQSLAGFQSSVMPRVLAELLMKSVRGG